MKNNNKILWFQKFFFFEYFNLLSLSLEKKEKVIEKAGLNYIKVIEIFKYEKNNNRYWDKTKLYPQVINKALPIIKSLYSDYLLLFLLNNAINDFVDINNILYIKDKNKNDKKNSI